MRKASRVVVRRLLTMLALAAATAALVPAGAAAHAILLRTIPADGAILAASPHEVTVTFDDSIRPRGGIAAVANASGASILAAPSPPFVSGRTLHIPLGGHLADGAYTIRWSIASEDGHPEQGVLAFAVGPGGTTPHPVLGASTPVSWFDVLMRSLYLGGSLVAVGAFAFALLVSDLFGATLRRPLAQLLFAALFVSFLGASGLEHAAASGTRFALLTRVAAVISVVGAGAAAMALLSPGLLVAAAVCSVALVALPTFAGHALDSSQPRILAAGIDLIHLGSAAVWIGGLVALLYVLPRTSSDAGAQTVALRRFSTAALASVALLAATGVGRALTELGSVSQVWSTSYGRALIAKTVLFAAALAFARHARASLSHSTRPGRQILAEVAVVAALLLVVGLLTDLRPGLERPVPARATPGSAAR